MLLSRPSRLADRQVNARVSVVVPNWNGAHHLAECLTSLEQQTYRNFETILVDNGSRDDSAEVVARFESVKWIALGENLGFGAAANIGIRSSTSELVVLLNNDTRAEPDWLERLVAAVDETSEASFAASKLLRYDRPDEIDAAGDGYSLWKANAVSVGQGDPASLYTTREWTFGACAAAALYRRSMLEDIGLFDEDFVLHFEDIDLDLRAQVAGYRCVYVPDAIVHHKRGASTDTWAPDVQARAMRNRIWVASKNLPGPLLTAWWVCFVIRAPVIFLLVVVRWPPTMLRMRNIGGRSLVEAATAWRNGLGAGVGGARGKRRQTRAARRLGSRSVMGRIRARPQRSPT